MNIINNVLKSINNSKIIEAYEEVPVIPGDIEKHYIGIFNTGLSTKADSSVARWTVIDSRSTPFFNNKEKFKAHVKKEMEGTREWVIRYGYYPNLIEKKPQFFIFENIQEYENWCIKNKVPLDSDLENKYLIGKNREHRPYLYHKDGTLRNLKK